MRTFKKFNKRSRTLTPSGELTRRFLERLAQMVKCPEQIVLVELWRNWPVVMGEDISAFCLPLGHKDDRLEIGCEDTMAMQELQYLRGEVLDRANSFMEKEFFRDLKIHLILDQKPLWQAGGDSVYSKPPEPAGGNCEGTWLDSMDPDSPVARAYRAYCRRKDA
ncbi:MAG: DUF721 domain-containing protein [Desulfovibrionaceae bacterium]|nr:DUF721 domain-containing protein [Desulfovibrionaceae bacterium]